MKTLRNIAVVVGLLALLVQVPPAFAQFAETTGTIQGSVRDSSGGVIPGAEVELSGVAQVSGKIQTTDRIGYFRFPQLPAGKYTLTVTAAGFKKYIEKDILLETGKKLTFDIEMQVGEVAAIVEVTSAPENIDVSSSKSQVTVTTSQILIAPKPRTVLDIVQWAPGARNEPAAGGFQLDGSSASENQYTIEGQDTTEILHGTAGVNPPPDFFKEVQVKTSGFEAEHGGALGGLVNLQVKSGGPEWHGAGIFYLRHSGLNAGPRHENRLDPDATLPSPPFTEPPQEYRPKEDTLRIFEPGFEAGGPVWKDRIFLQASYIPRLEKTSREVNGTFVPTGGVPQGLRTFTRTQNTHFAVARLDGRVTNNIRAWALWNYAYSRTSGIDRPGPDDIDGKTNEDASIDANIRRPDRGDVFPNVMWRMGGDWTPTSKLVVNGAYGKWYADAQNRGTPVGVRHLFQATNTNLAGLDGTVVGSAFQHVRGFSDLTDNRQTLRSAVARTQVNADASYVFHAAGTHTFKGGWSLNRLSNDTLLTRQNTAHVDVFWNSNLKITAPFSAGCAPIQAFNFANFPGGPDRILVDDPTTTTVDESADNYTSATDPNACRGIFGYYRVRDLQTRGKVSSNNHAFYFQDGWSIGYGITINAGIRFEREYLPSFAGPGTGNPSSVAVISKPIEFGFSDKAAPRIGAAWDVFRNGKVKVFGSWGWFYDIMKYEMPQGSFGGQYWHNCYFTLDTDNFSSIQPTQNPPPFTCTTGATGQLPGTFLGFDDLRIPANTSQNIDNVVDPNLEPVRQTELVIGGEWAMTRDIGIEVRWAHRRLRNTVEDAGILGPLGEQFLIVNPGERIGKFPLRGDCANPGDTRCDSVLGISTLPAMPKAKREYDAVEIRLNKRFTGNWYMNASYTWSRLFGNYSGLADSDGDLAQRNLSGGGRTDPNVSRNFDEQEIEWNSFGEPEFGRLSTDRPHTFKAFGGYRLKYWGMESIFGVNQQWFIGTPRGTRMQFGQPDIAVYVFGRGNLADITQDPNTGLISLNGIKKGARTPMFSQTDFTFTHHFNLSKTNEALKLEFQFNALNLWNNGGKITFKDRTDRDRFEDIIIFQDPTCNDGTGLGCASQSEQFRKFFFDGFDPIAAENAQMGSVRFDPLYRAETRLQEPRELRLSLRLIF